MKSRQFQSDDSMAMSNYYRSLRNAVGNTLLMVPAVAAVIRDSDGRVLFQQDRRGAWSLPAGAIEPGETPAQAVMREVWEETGLRVRPTRVLGVFGGADGFRYVYPSGDAVEYLAVVFACVAVSGTLGGVDDDTARLQFFFTHDPPPLEVPYPFERFNAPEAVFQWDEGWLDVR